MTTLSTKREDLDLLKHVQEKIILKDHTVENLSALLQLCNLEITVDEVMDDNKRMMAMKNMMLAVHPNNFPYNEDAQYIFEDIQRFYDLCTQNIAETKGQDGSKSARKRRRRRTGVSPTSVVEMVVQCKFKQRDYLLYLLI